MKIEASYANFQIYTPVPSLLSFRYAVRVREDRSEFVYDSINVLPHLLDCNLLIWNPPVLQSVMIQLLCYCGISQAGPNTHHGRHGRAAASSAVAAVAH